MKVNICTCKNFDELKRYLSSCRNICNCMLDDDRNNNAFSILEKQNFHINYIKYNSKENIIELLQLCQRHNSSIIVENNDDVIIGFGNEKYKWLALYLSIKMKKKLILVNSDLDVLEWLKYNKCSYVTLVAEHKDIKIRMISEINKIQYIRRKKGEIIYFGYITARDEWSLLWLILKNTVYSMNENKKYITVDRLEHNAETIISSNNVEVVPYKMSDLRIIHDKLIDNNVDLLTMIGHGRDDVFWLNNGAVCGRCNNKKIGPYKDEKNLPSCYYTGRCFKNMDTELIFANEIAARNVFLNACYSSKIEQGLFVDDFNIVFSFLDGYAASYLGSSFIVDGQSIMNYYYIAQLLSGIKLGQASYNVSNFYLDYKLGHDLAFFLVGNPSFYLENFVKSYECKFDENLDCNEYCIENQIYLITVIFQNNKIAQDVIGLKKKIKIIFSNNRDIYFIFRINNKKTYLDIFSKTIIKPGILKISFDELAYINPKTAQNFEAILGIGIYPTSKFKNILLETKELANKIAKEKKYQLYNLKKISALYKRIDKYNEKILSLSQNVLQFLVEYTHNKGFTWNDQCLANGLNFKSYKSAKREKCSNCGRNLYVLKYSHDLFSNLESEFFCCSACGIVKDSPSNTKDILVYNKGESTVMQGDKVKQVLCIENNTDDYMCGYAGMAIAWGKCDLFTYDKKLHTEKIELYPGEKKEYTLIITAMQETMPHNYWLYSNIILNGLVWTIKKDLWVVPRSITSDR